MTRALAAVALAALLGVGAATAASAPPSARDRAAARAFVAAASTFLKAIDESQGQALTVVQAELAPCASAFATKVDERRLSELESFLAQARALPQLPVLWRKMLSRWNAIHTTSGPLKVVLAAARSQRSQVDKLGRGAAQPGICEALAAWEDGGWSNTYVADLQQAWNDSVAVDQVAMDNARNRVSDVAPELTKLGLSRDQILTLIVATL